MQVEVKQIANDELARYQSQPGTLAAYTQVNDRRYRPEHE
jgi:hypothetical protein